MAKNRLLTKGQMKVRYPHQWLLVADYKLDRSTSLRSGRVVASSRDREEIHRALKKHSGKLCIHFTGSLPRDTGVLFPGYDVVEQTWSMNARMTGRGGDRVKLINSGKSGSYSCFFPVAFLVILPYFTRN